MHVTDPRMVAPNAGDPIGRIAMRIQSPMMIRCAGRVSSTLMRMLFRTLQKQTITYPGGNPYECEGRQHMLFSVWHDSAILAAFGGKHARTVALTSRHRDGDFVAGLIGGVGVTVIRGSSGRHGSAAARQLLDVAETHDIVITPDGPRGPRRQMSRGVIFLGSRTGNPIVPTAFACASAWEIRGSWTTQTVPKPFSRVVLMAGKPINVPPSLDANQLEQYRQALEKATFDLQEQADDLLAMPSP